MVRIRLEEPPKKRIRLHDMDFIMGKEGSEKSRQRVRDNYDRRVNEGKTQCIACGGTGINSKGGPCYPCEVRKQKCMK